MTIYKSRIPCENKELKVLVKKNKIGERKTLLPMTWSIVLECVQVNVDYEFISKSLMYLADDISMTDGFRMRKDKKNDA